MQVNLKEFYYLENVFHLLECSNAVLQHLNITNQQKNSYIVWNVEILSYSKVLIIRNFYCSP